jgi:predicted RNA-binding protein YlxR (DUF448 family)
VVCRTRREDTALHRAGRNTDGQWYVGRGNGRGIWWCKESDCGTLLRVVHVARALRTAVPASEVDVLLALCGAGPEKAVPAVVEE